MPLSKPLMLVLYVLASFLSLFFIDNDNLALEMGLKLSSILFLSFYYISSSKSINYWYILVLASSLLSDSFLIFDTFFLLLGTLFMLLNRIIYIVILSKNARKAKASSYIQYGIPFLIVFVLVMPYLSSYFYDDISIPAFTMGGLSVIIAGLAFSNYLNAFTLKNKLLFIGLITIILADMLIAYNKFVDYKLLYVIIYSVMYYVARLLICEAMIDRKN